MKDIYRVHFCAECSEEDAASLRKILAQTICDEFELHSVFGVSIESDTAKDDE